MKIKGMILATVSAVLFAACPCNPHFITDKSYRQQVHNDYESRCATLGIADQHFDTLCCSEREAMEFLYAYMPYCDMADYDANFFLNQVRTAFEARKTMPWGDSVPEDIFRHFVLVYRVNNENLDTARMLFYRELKPRLEGLSMEQAALEVNHWCHEHVAYRASDGRTSSPLATMRTALGRCGEESTFTVTALRSVGIPARQCYTPRWAHCDDNHAWVEVYVGGEWKYLGACEPEPRLNMAWFTIAASRCMMVHTKAFGRYKGDEEVVRRTGLYSELNLLNHYAPTRRVTATVCDSNGKPMAGARVEFKQYNYSEYYTLAAYNTDAEGKASLTTGLGDLLVWATDGVRTAFCKVDVRRDSTVILTLGNELPTEPVTFEITPPEATANPTTATAEEVTENSRRLAFEDSLRAAYTSTFHTGSDCQPVRKSEGNWQQIEQFISSHPDALDYLATFSDKDMRDISASVLEAHLTSAHDYPDIPYKEYAKGIMPARVSNEMVRPYRKELSKFKVIEIDQLIDWTLINIAVDDTGNYYNCPISPVGVYRLRHADAHSRDIFFVAACRIAGIPAWLDNATNIIYVYSEGQWRIVQLSGNSTQENAAATATLTLTYSGTQPEKPLYWPHFSLSVVEDGSLRSFDFEDDPRMISFPATLELPAGTYCLSTGNRYPDGSVRSRLQFFTLAEGSSQTLPIVILPLIQKVEAIGKVDPATPLFDDVTLYDYAGPSTMLYINLGPYGEPSRHLSVDLRADTARLRQWGGMILMTAPAEAGVLSWRLPNTDSSPTPPKLEQLILKASNNGRSPAPLQATDYPIVALLHRNGDILYLSKGYKIGSLQQALDIAARY
ncbi:MAG: transglutaminase domain-containing protein [Bacteroidales bacterium]|nr:transglutaminase domain-containing protein [Bacteroidales bacterium]